MTTAAPEHATAKENAPRMTKRTIVVGDIHGCFDELSDLLDKAELGEGDSIVSVGDLIVKGPKNREVIELFSGGEQFSAVLGNHDRAILQFWRGGRKTLKPAQERCRDELAGERERFRDYLESLPAMIDLGSHLVVHAGVRPGVTLAAQTIEDLTELRTLGADRTSREGTPWYDEYDGEKIVLFGHWPAAEPRRGRRAVGLDTGCVYGFHLTAYVIETDEMIQVRARREYEPA
ncbi:MAG TPA: metallophosphoesterase [Pyrinomonadaceae bacterium]|nr:metallophosphoesterase [Pyrinomonadaceae bacterium]